MELLGTLPQTTCVVKKLDKQQVKESRALSELIGYWKGAVGEYVRQKREGEGKVQKELLGTNRRTVSDVENGVLNFTLSTLLEVLHSVGGDISEAFKSRVPKEFHNQKRQHLHEKLEVLLQADAPWSTVAAYNIESVYLNYQQQNRGETSSAPSPAPVPIRPARMQ